MKRICSVLLIFAMLLSCGCSAETIISEPSPTPPPTAVPVPEPTSSPEPDEYIGALRISEIMTKNHCTLRDSDGDFSDWIELENSSDTPLNLNGWSICTDDGKPWLFPDISLEAGEYLLLFASGKNRNENELHTDFKLSPGETVKLITPRGNVSHSLSFDVDINDRSYALIDGEYKVSSYPSPGYENSGNGYNQWQNSLAPQGPLIINEVMVANHFGSYDHLFVDSDWVELKNISDETLILSDFYLSDDKDDYRLWQLPEKKLAPGASIIVLCSDEGSDLYPCAPFKLSSSEEHLYLSTRDGLIDYAFLRDIPLNGSFGRMEGENGFFYFPDSSMKYENYGGYRRISETPFSPTKDGVFNNADSIKVELHGKGTIYYSLDGSLPDGRSPVYTEPITIDSTCVVRAVAIEDGLLPSRALTLNFILNENHSLPVVSLVTDAPHSMSRLLLGGIKDLELPGSISLYENDGSFTIGCGVSLTGQQSLMLAKKSMKVDFRGVYGEDTLNYDVFDTGSSEYSSLALRAGQDNHRVIFRQEIWQDLCLEMTDMVPTQHSKFCVVYLNGEYYGICCIKEDISRQYFADLQKVSTESVDDAKIPDEEPIDFTEEIFDYCRHNDMSKAEHYEHICSLLDIDSLIDWVILEGVSGNVDLFRNVRFFRSSELDGKWKSVLFDLDHAMLDDYLDTFALGKSFPEEDFPFMGVLGYGYFGSERMTVILNSLLQNEEFKDKLLSRYAEVYNTHLSNEKILERIDYYQALLEPEVTRDWERWYKNPSRWYRYVDMLRRCITELDWENYAKDSLCRYLQLSEEEIEHYFG